MKRILIFSLAYLPHVGGAELAVKEITDRIGGIEFEMVTLRFASEEAPEEKIGNVLVHRIGRGGASRLDKLLFQFRAARAAARLHRQRRFDAAWAIMAHSAGVPAALFSARTGVPFLLTLQEGDPPERIERQMLPLWPWFSRAFTRAAKAQAISTFLADWAKRRGAREVEVIPNGVDVARFSGAPVAHEGLLLITASRLLGAGPEEGKLRALAAELGVASRVEFAGEVSHDALPRELHAADIFVRPSRSEGMGNAFIEAMAAGLPVIATLAGGIPDFLAPGETGWAVAKDSPEEIAKAVEDILAHPEEVRRVTAAAATLVKERYDWDIVARRMRELLERLFATR